MKKIISCLLLLCAFVFVGCAGSSNFSTQGTTKKIGDFYFADYVEFCGKVEGLGLLTALYPDHAQKEHFSKIQNLYGNTLAFVEEEMAAVAAIAVYESELADKELFFQLDGDGAFIRARLENGKYLVDVNSGSSITVGDETHEFITSFVFAVYKNTTEKIWTVSYTKEKNACSINVSYSPDESCLKIVINSYLENNMMYTSKKSFYALQGDRFAYSISVKYGTGSSESFYEIECLCLSLNAINFKVAKTKTFEEGVVVSQLETFTQTTKNDICGIVIDTSKLEPEDQLNAFGNLKEWQQA